jgi:hypothetical protein
MKTQKQQYKEGAIVEINLSNSFKIYGRLLPSYNLCVYDYLIDVKKDSEIEDIIANPILFYVGIYKAVITDGYFNIIGLKKLTSQEIKNIPPFFTQSEPNIEKCFLIYYDGSEKQVTPAECIGLEKASVYNDLNVINRIEDHYAGRKNIGVERNKVMLDRNDIRYMNPHIKWSFKEEKFYK